MDELNDAGTYFDAGPQQVTQNGIYHYLCTRNNNFSNRDQKGTIVVTDYSSTYSAIGWNGGTAKSTSSGDQVYVPQGSVSQLTAFTLTSYPSDTDTSFSGSVASNYLVVSPVALNLNSGSTVQIQLGYNVNHLGSATMYRADDLNSDFSSIDASFSGGVAYADTTQGGAFVVQTKTNWGAVAGIIIAVLVAVAAILGVVYWRCKKMRDAKKNDKEKVLTPNA